MESMQDPTSPVEPVKEKAADLARAAEGQARGVFDRGKQSAARDLGSIAGALREASDKVERDGALGSCLRWAADAAQKLSGTLEGRSLDDLVASGRNLALRNPAVFVGGAALAGLLLGRVLRAGGRRLAGRTEGEAA